jgi:hypothetical protein
MLFGFDDSIYYLETQEKVIAMKHFFFEYYRGLFLYLDARRERLSEMDDQVKLGIIPLDSIETVYRNHFQEETNKFVMNNLEVHSCFFHRLRKKRCQRKNTAQDFQILAKIGKGGYGDVSILLAFRKKSKVVKKFV